jgi:hypothetical protein
MASVKKRARLKRSSVSCDISFLCTPAVNNSQLKMHGERVKELGCTILAALVVFVLLSLTKEPSRLSRFKNPPSWLSKQCVEISENAESACGHPLNFESVQCVKLIKHLLLCVSEEIDKLPNP